MRCLVIDDNPDDRLLVERIITGSGHRAVSVASGEDALSILRHEHFDVAVVDLRMAGMSGFQTLRELRRRDRSLKLLVVSGFDDRDHIMAAVEAGADGYLIKDELSEQITRALQDLRAGKTPLSSSVSREVLGQLKQRLGSEPPVEEPTPRKKLVDVSGELILARIGPRPKKTE